MITEFLPPRYDANVPQVIHIPEPTIAKIRAAVQTLASRNHRPFEGHLFHGYIDPASVGNAAQELTFPDIIEIRGPNGESFIRIGGTGVLFLQTPAVNGAIIFAETSKMIELQTRR